MTEERKNRMALEVSRYIFALQSPPNAWGQHIVNDMQSHAYLWNLGKRYGQARVARILAAYYLNGANK